MDAHEPEYVAAADAMAETYGQPQEPATYKAGQAILFRLADWNYPKSGTIHRVTNTGMLAVVGEDCHRYLITTDDVEGSR